MYVSKSNTGQLRRDTRHSRSSLKVSHNIWLGTLQGQWLSFLRDQWLFIQTHWSGVFLIKTINHVRGQSCDARNWTIDGDGIQSMQLVICRYQTYLQADIQMHCFPTPLLLCPNSTPTLPQLYPNSTPTLPQRRTSLRLLTCVHPVMCLDTQHLFSSCLPPL